ncbi:MAG: extradiol dioxygenase [Marivirga sp.]|nr:extradiol dioxygenase [Marivirga sp.]
MTNSFKPDHYNSVSPYFVIDGAQRYVDFLKRLFNAKERRRYDMPDGTIMHIEIEIDDTIVMMGDASDKFPANTSLMHVYVPDVDRIFNLAVDLGCEVIERPKVREGDPDKRGTFKDYTGNVWSVSTQLKS